jgi:hypothetical protein
MFGHVVDDGSGHWNRRLHVKKCSICRRPLPPIATRRETCDRVCAMRLGKLLGGHSGQSGVHAGVVPFREIAASLGISEECARLAYLSGIRKMRRLVAA